MKQDGKPSQLSDDEHDIIFFRKEGTGERFPIDPGLHEHGAAKRFPIGDAGGRKARDLARPDAGSLPAHTHVGPAMAIAPTRPEPASQNGTCVIINQENVAIRNTWSTARLNNEPNPAAVDPFDGPLAPLRSTFEIAVAWPDGEVQLLQKKRGFGQTLTSTPLALGREGELWYQLRNGLVAGRVVLFVGGSRVVPVVNVASLEDDNGNVGNKTELGAKE
jgi:hypothetical protein